MARYKDVQGYIWVKRPDIQPNNRGYVLEHRAIWIDNHGKIPDGAVIHHKDSDKANNHISNLEMYSSNGEHRHHAHVDLSWFEPDHPRLEPFDLVDMMFIRSHLPLDKCKPAAG